MPTRHENTTINLAARVLYGIVPSSQATDMTALRLALRVILPHCRDNPYMAEFWRHATNPHRLVHETCIGPYRAILAQLKRAGFTIDGDIDLRL